MQRILENSQVHWNVQMNAMIKRNIKRFLPPVILSACSKALGRGIDFQGNYVSWQAALAASSGYDSDEILARVAVSTRKVISGEAAYERDSVAFDHIEYSWPLLASLLQVALECRSLRVIDFGGALGSTWRQNKKFLERLNIPIAWHVVEQGNFVRLGKAEFSDNILSFDGTIAEASKDGADVVLFCSSLCYVEDPSLFLKETMMTNAPFLIIDRFPLINGDRDRIAVQKVTEPIYHASYPVRLFAEVGLLSNWLREWRLVETWISDLQPDPGIRHCGFFLERR